MAAFLPVGNGQFADERMDQCLCIGEMTAGLLDRLRQQGMHELDVLPGLLGMAKHEKRLLIEGRQHI